MKDLSVLIVEDEEVSQRVMTRMLEPVARCDMAANGKEAVHKVIEAYEAGAPYDLICLDLQMPELDGHAALRSIREYESVRGIANKNVVRVLITSQVIDARDVVSGFREGCEGYLAKPISKAELYAELLRLGVCEKDELPPVGEK